MPMTIKSRLQLALNLVIVTTSSLAAVGMVLLIFWFEDTLFYNHLQSDLSDQIRNHQTVTTPLLLPMTDTTYYKLPKSDQRLLPEVFRGYPQGGHEVLLPDKAYNLFVRHDGDWVHVLVQDQSEFERYELMVFAGGGFGVLLVWGLGFVLSRRLSRQILEPVSRLAVEVATSAHKPGERLEMNYPDDETGQLARAFDRYVLRVNELLLREQQFSANASHELRTPMMVIRGAVDMLKESEPQPGVLRQLQRIDDALLQMQQQTELFLQLSRTPDALSGKDDEQPLADIVARQLAHWQPLADARGLTLTLEVNGDAGQRPATMMIAVLNNLLRNAMQHTSEGEICVQLDAHYLQVSDTGSGIAAGLQDQVCTRGISEANPTGFGLGLAIVERICEHRGWRLEIVPHHPAGTRVTVYFDAV